MTTDTKKPQHMQVTKRNGDFVDVSFDKVLNRLRVLSTDLQEVNVYEIAQKVCARIYDGVKTSELDELAAQLCSSMIAEEPEYGTLASRIIVSNHHKNTSPSFSETMHMLYTQDVKQISDEVYSIVMANRGKLNSSLNYERDYLFDYFGFKTLEKMYLQRVGETVVERPQHMLMRVALGIHGTRIHEALQTYDLMSQRFFTHATPTLFNAGTPCPQNSSCYVVHMQDDSIDGIFNTLKDCANISKYAGGIGMNIHNIRAKNAVIKGTNGRSDGIVPMLGVFNSTMRYVDQAGRRKGSLAVFLEPWHADIEQFLDLRKNFGLESERARDLFLALWVPDLFMKRVQADEMWSLMCPATSTGLSDCYGDEFEALYCKYEAEGAFIRQVRAQELWFRIIDAQIETGVPYIGYKDHVNRKSNQMNIGTIKSSNLCMEIMEVSKPDEIAVCNLASICLPRFVFDGKFDFEALERITKVIVRNLNKIIDVNFYPVDKARKSNLTHRPVGVGVQGLADVFMMLRVPFESEDARKLNAEIFETIYYACLETSIDLAEELQMNLMSNVVNFPNEFEAAKNGKAFLGAYPSFDGSPASNGMLQFDLWGSTPETDRYDWDNLRRRLQRFGMRNSLLVAPMPTASTSQILGATECIEPITSNIYKRNTLAGEFIIINKHLVDDLKSLKLWSTDMKTKIVMNDGSVQNIQEIPENVRELYKTAWEIRQKSLIDLAADRGRFICQSQSMNLFMETPDYQRMSSMHFYAWKRGLKTGIYYLRTKAKAKTQKFTVEPTADSCSINNRNCVTCSS
jgi:ribonucleoside-diphosphate reductase alpha chain